MTRWLGLRPVYTHCPMGTPNSKLPLGTSRWRRVARSSRCIVKSCRWPASVAVYRFRTVRSRDPKSWHRPSLTCAVLHGGCTGSDA